MESIDSVWTILYIIISFFSTICGLLTILLSFKNSRVGDSAIQYIAYSLCFADFVYAFSRLCYYLAVCFNHQGLRDMLQKVDHGEFVGVHVVYLETSEWNRTFIVAIALIGDIALLCSFCWVILMTFELKRLIKKSMDRGKKKERMIVRRYSYRTYGLAITFAFFLIVSSFLPSKQEKMVRKVLLIFHLLCIWASFSYPLYIALTISFRKHHSIRPIDPGSLLLYRRIRNLVISYCILVFPECTVEFLKIVLKCHVPWTWIRIAQSLFYMSGGIESMIIGISATCCFRTLKPIMPASVYDQLLENGYFSEDAEKTYLNDPLEPPMHLPVFVVTDVQDSTALWATAPEAMSEAQTLHDDLLRKELLRFRGYEITTCGDAFQLAFRNVTDAIGWCIDVQEKLMRLRWPMEITNQKNCGKVYNIWGKMIFNGLRVRMAIHDGDDQIIYSKHPMTGKMTYLGISEIVVREIVDLGDGGDILISDSALKRLQEEEPGEEFMQTFYCESFGLLERAELSVSFELHHLFLSSLGYRNDKERYKLEHLRSMRQLLSAVVQH